MASQQSIIIIRRAAESPTLNSTQQQFLQEVVSALESGQEVDRDTQVQVQQLLGQAVFG